MGAVIARYEGIDGYDWVAIPLLPYLYAVENAADVPAHVDRDTVERLRNHYRETHLESLGANLPRGNFVHGGWTQLVGAAYERRIFAFRFQTSPEQDDALIRQLNAGPNQTRFNLLFNNCADFSRELLNHYFPHVFARSIFPDAGVTTPKQTAYRLMRYARKHPGTKLAIFEIPQIPGYRHGSHSAKGIDESLATTVYAIPIAILNPYLAGGLAADYLVRGRYHLIPKHPQVLSPDTLSLLTAATAPAQNPASARATRNIPSSAESGPGADVGAAAASQPAGESNPSLQGIGARNE
jgi:hypothetical protein